MKIEVGKSGYEDTYRFLLWRGCTIVDSGYGFDTATRAAEYAAKSLADLREANRIARRARWLRFFHTGDSVASKKSQL